ncbi:hypothetical protein CPAR01_08634, partial [Colletotrichum paranaense]
FLHVGRYSSIPSSLQREIAQQADCAQEADNITRTMGRQTHLCVCQGVSSPQDTKKKTANPGQSTPNPTKQTQQAKTPTGVTRPTSLALRLLEQGTLLRPYPHPRIGRPRAFAAHLFPARSHPRIPLVMGLASSLGFFFLPPPAEPGWPLSRALTKETLQFSHWVFFPLGDFSMDTADGLYAALIVSTRVRGLVTDAATFRWSHVRRQHNGTSHNHNNSELIAIRP